MNIQTIGYIGLAAVAFAWLPQSWETLRTGICGANPGFLALSAIGSVALTIYAVLRGDTVFALLNAMTTCGALLNIWFRAFPRRARR